MSVRATILIFSPRGPGDCAGFSLEHERWHLVQAQTLGDVARAMARTPIDLAILDDPSWELARAVVGQLDTADEPIPRIWISSSPEAPASSGKLGIDALILMPHEPDALEQQVSALLTPHGGSFARPDTFAAGSQPSLPARFATARPRPPTSRATAQADDGWDEESTGHWP